MENLSKNQEWTPLEEKTYEEALVKFLDDMPDGRQGIAGRTSEGLEEYYNKVEEEIMSSETRKTKLPEHKDKLARADVVAAERSVVKATKGMPWTVKEHIKFLEGVEKYGWSEWKKISSYVETRDGVQVASHAQKFYLRQMKGKGINSRASIHDITLESVKKALSLGSERTTNASNILTISNGFIGDIDTNNFESSSPSHQVLNQGRFIGNDNGFHNGTLTMTRHPAISQNQVSMGMNNSTAKTQEDITEKCSLVDEYLNLQNGDIYEGAYISFPSSQVNYNEVVPLNSSTTHHYTTGHSDSMSQVARLNTSGQHNNSPMVDLQNRHAFVRNDSMCYNNSTGAHPRVSLSNYLLNANHVGPSNNLPIHHSDPVRQMVASNMYSHLKSHPTYLQNEEFLRGNGDVNWVNKGSASSSRSCEFNHEWKSI